MPQADLRNVEPPVQDILDDPMTRQIMQRWGVQAEDLMALLQEAKESCDQARRLAALEHDQGGLVLC